MTDTFDVVEVIITGPADFITKHCQRLVEKRLIACAQVTNIESTYRWEGSVEKDPEARAALHTVRDRVAAVSRLILDEHPYDVPCVLVLPVESGNPAYLRWVSESVEPTGSGET